MPAANAEEREKKIKTLASVGAAGVNFALGLTKVLCGVYTNSIAVISDGVNNFGDVFSNAGAAAGFSLEGKKASKKFPFGLGRLEYAVTLFMALIVIVVGGVFAWQASERFFYHPVVTFSWVQFGVVAATAAVKAVMAGLFFAEHRRFGSGVIKAQALDSLLDTFITLFTLVGLFLARYISFPADALVGLTISAVMIAEGVKLLVPAVYKLIGGADEEREEALRALISAHKAVRQAQIRLFDCGAKRAEAFVSLEFEQNLTEGEINAVKKAVKEGAEKEGISVIFTEKEEL